MTADPVASSRFAIDVLTTLDDVSAIRDEWTALGEKAAVGPSMTAAVAIAWLRHLNKGRPFVITARSSAGVLVGVIPLHSRKVGTTELLRWIGHGLGTIGEFVIDPDVAGVDAALSNALSRQSRCVTELVDISRSSAGFASLTREPRLHHALTEHDVVPVVNLRGVESAEAYLAQAGHRKLRQNMARADRANTDTVVEVVVDANELERVFAEVAAVNIAAESANPRLNFLEGNYGRYLSDSVADAMRLHRSAVLILRSDSVVRGFLFCFTSGSTAYACLARFDPAARELGPGHQLLRAAIDWAIDCGMDTLDLQIGDDPYKLRWSSDSYKTFGLTIARSGFLASAQLLVAAVNRLSG